MAKEQGKHRGHGEGSIYPRKDGRWTASISLDTGGRKYFYGKTRREVQEKLRAALHEQKQGTLITEKDQKLATYLAYWLEQVQRPTVKPSTYIQNRTVVNKHLIPALGHISLQKLTVQHLQHLYTQKLDAGLATSYVKLMHSVLHEALENATRSNLIARNIAGLVSPPRVEPHEAQALTIEQAQKLLEVARGHRLETFILMAVTTGMRRGELFALQWDDIDFHQGELSVKRSVSSIASYGYVVGEPKTKSSRRKIILPNVVKDALMEHRTHQDEQKLQAGEKWQERGLVFCNIYGGYMHVSGTLQAFHKLTEEAGLPAMRLHDLRHSAATILLTKGVHPKVVQELLGHSNINTTMNIYSHVQPAMQKDAMDKMGDVFQGHAPKEQEITHITIITAIPGQEVQQRFEALKRNMPSEYQISYPQEESSSSYRISIQHRGQLTPIAYQWLAMQVKHHGWDWYTTIEKNENA